MPRLSKRSCNAPLSPVRKFVPMISAAKAAGVTVHEVNIGQPDCETPQTYFEALKQFKTKTLNYEPASGTARLREAWSRFYDRILKLPLPASDFLITAGGSEALLLAISTIADPSEEVLVFEPTYANYIGIAELLGVKLSGVLTKFEDGFKPPSISEIEKKITLKTRGILLCNPGNPTGVSYSESYLKELTEWASKNNLWVISDECYREIVFDGVSIHSLLSFGTNNVIVVDSLSKRASLCGARVGCIVASDRAAFEAMTLAASQRICVSAAEQFAASAVLDSITREMLFVRSEVFHARARSFLDSMKAYPEILVGQPDGAFFTIIKFPNGTAEDFAQYLLAEFRQDRETVCITPAHGFYLDSAFGIREARIAMVLEGDIMERVGTIIGEGYRAFQTEVLKKVS